MYTMVYLLLLPYALVRWGSGRETVAGLAVIVVPAALSLVVSWSGVGDAIGGIADHATNADDVGFVRAAKRTGAIGWSVYDYATTGSTAWPRLRP